MTVMIKEHHGEIVAKVPWEMRHLAKESNGKWEPNWNCWRYPQTPFAAHALLSTFAGDISFCDDTVKRLAETYNQALAAKGRDDLPDIPGLSRSAWMHQRQAYHFCKDLGGAMLAMDMGVGKSLTAVGLTVNRPHHRVLIVCPKSVITVWPKEFAFAKEEMEITPLRDGSVQKRTNRLRDKLEVTGITGKPLVAIINYESFWREQMAKLILKYEWDVVIYDECFPAGVQINTPDGKKKIEDVRSGDVVYGWDHDKGEAVQTQVKNTFGRHYYKDFVCLNGLPMTYNHPVFTIEANGYVPACKVNINDTLLTLREGCNGHKKVEDSKGMSTVRGVVSSVTKICSVLQQKLRQKNNVGEYEHREEERIFSKTSSNNIQGGCQEEATQAPFAGKQPIKQRACQTESASDPAKEYSVQNAQWREWSSNGKAAASSFRIAWRGMGRRICSKNWMQAAKRWIPNSLQNRYCSSKEDDRSRSGWGKSRLSQGAESRHSQRSVFRKQWVDNSAFCKQRDKQQHSSCIVYNIETGTGNYFAEGSLVHNCHRIKSASGKASKFAARLFPKARYRLGLTGTPYPHSPLDIFGQFRALDYTIFGNNYHRFKLHYAIMGGFGGKEVVSFKNLDEMTEKFERIAFRVKAKDVLDLPEDIHTYRSCTLSAKTKKIYKDLDDQLYAEIKQGEDEEGRPVTPANAMVKVLRLQQLTSGYLKTDDGELVEVGSEKRDLLKDVLSDFPDNEPVVVFCRFTSDIQNVLSVCKEVGRSCGELSGHQDDLGDFQDGKFDVIAVQVRSGGVGVDLTRAAYCIYYSIGHSLGDYEQSLARTLRPGQTRTVRYYHLLAEGTVDVTVYAALRKRKEVVEYILSGHKPSLDEAEEEAEASFFASCDT